MVGIDLINLRLSGTRRGGIEQVGTHRSETGRAQNKARNQIGLSSLPMWPGSRGALVTLGRSHGNRGPSSQSINRDIDSIGRNISELANCPAQGVNVQSRIILSQSGFTPIGWTSTSPRRGAMARCRARCGNRGHSSIATLLQDFSSGLSTRACARWRAPWQPGGHLADHNARQKKFRAEKSFFGDFMVGVGPTRFAYDTPNVADTPPGAP